jgi:hypothetical protein
MATDGAQTVLVRCSNSRIVRRFLGAYLFQARRIWNHLPTSLRFLLPGRAYGRHFARPGSPRFGSSASTATGSWIWTTPAKRLKSGTKSVGSGWPKSPRALAGRLRRAQTFLRTLGIEIVFGREGRLGTRTIGITAIGYQDNGHR